MKVFLLILIAINQFLVAQNGNEGDSIVIDYKDFDKTLLDSITNMEKISKDSVVIKIPSEIFEYQIIESKLIFSDAIISDATGDTLDAKYQFEILFESLSELDMISEADEFQKLELNRLMKAVIDYYENKSITIDKIETGLSVAVFRDKLNKYIYSQKLDELEFIEEEVEIIPGHVPITYNNKVASIIKFFQNQGRRSVQNWLNRVDRYKSIMLPILEEEGVPPELFYLAMIESGLNPLAYSYAHASGPWQFIASTGRVYGLNRNWWIDERRDFEKSTYAAAKYLKDLYAEFGDWYLAFAAYNAGSSRVKKAMRRNNSTNFWELTRLPAQTRNYVPNIMAALFIANDPKKYGFVVNSEPQLKWVEKEIDKSVSLETIAKCADVDVSILAEYNPEIKEGFIPPLQDEEKYTLRLPIIFNQQFDSLFSLVETEKSDGFVFIEHKVRRGDNLWDLARKYNTSWRAIKEINKIKGNTVQIGWTLQIPSEGYTEYRKSTKPKTGRFVYHTVRRGDTISEIAEQYRTSQRKIRNWNGLKNDRIRIGQKLKIWKKY